MLAKARSTLRGLVSADSVGQLRRLLSLSRIVQFGIVGTAGAAFDMGTLAMLYGWVGVALLPAKLGAAEVGIVVAFVLNEVWTFAGEGGGGIRATGRRFLASNAIRALGIAVAAAVLVILKTWFGVWYLLANALGLGVGGMINYVLEALLAWRIHR